MEDRFYIQSSFGVLELTATTEISVSTNNSVTKHKLESGVDVADHVVNENVTVTLNGVISDIKRYSSGNSDASSLNVQDYYNLLTQIRDSKQPFTVVYDVRFPALKNCVFTAVNKVRTSETGTGYRVTISITQLRLSERSEQTVRRDNQANPNLTQSETGSRNSETETRVTATAGVTLVTGGRQWVINESPEGASWSEDLVTVDPEEEDGG